MDKTAFVVHVGSVPNQRLVMVERAGIHNVVKMGAVIETSDLCQG